MADARGGRMRIVDLKNGKEIFEGFIVDNITIKDIEFDEEKFNNLNVEDLTRDDLFNLVLAYRKQLKRKEQECEELKKEIINRNEKIEELRFSVSDLTNRLCDINAEKSFRIVDLEQTIAKIKEIITTALEQNALINLDKILQKINEVEDDKSND